MTAAGLVTPRPSVDVETEAISADGTTVPIATGVRLGIYERLPKPGELPAAAPAMRTFRYGERLRFTAKLRQPRNFRNPGAFDYEGYLAEHGISALGSSKLENVEVLSGFHGKKFELWRTRLHRNVLDKVNALWSPPEAALMDAHGHRR